MLYLKKVLFYLQIEKKECYICRFYTSQQKLNVYHLYLHR